MSTSTVNGRNKNGKVRATVEYRFGNKVVRLFSPEEVEATRVALGISIHDDTTIRAVFFAFLTERDYTMAYKMPFLLSFLGCMDRRTGSVSIDEALDGYA